MCYWRESVSGKKKRSKVRMLVWRKSQSDDAPLACTAENLFLLIFLRVVLPLPLPLPLSAAGPFITLESSSAFLLCSARSVTLSARNPLAGSRATSGECWTDRKLDELR